MAITISRGSPNAKSWHGPGFNPEILVLVDGIALRGTINYGRASLRSNSKSIWLSFLELAEAMMEANKDTAIKAFGKALSEGT